MKRTLLGYVIGMTFCNTEALINSKGCMCGYDERHKLFKTKEQAERFAVKHELNDYYIREYMLETFDGTTFNAGKIGYALAGLK